MSRWPLLWVFALGLPGCSGEPATAAQSRAMVVEAEPDLDLDLDLDRATAAAADFSERLRTALQARMQSEGPVGAVNFCHAQAPRIADAVMAEHGVRLGRVAVPGRNRHPGNTARDWQRPVLAGFQSQVDAGAAAGDLLYVQQENLPPGVALRMMRGIAVEPVCLACHGKGISAPVAQVIADHYPDDAATGFDAGDLRGGLWVQVPDPPSRESRP